LANSVNRSLRTAVVGVSGYAGGELARLLLRHPQLTNTPPVFLGRMGDPDAHPTALTELHPELSALPFADELQVSAFDWKQLERESIDILFLATPHEQSRAWVPDAIGHGMRVIDLSGAWRLHSDALRAVYKLEDADAALATELQAEAVYGSPELHGPAIKTARLVANPGCYSTSIILALAPLMRANLIDLDHGIICDAKSGVSGAGKALVPTNLFMHAADLAEDQIQFTPHLLPIPRGILSTIYVRLNKHSDRAQIQSIFDQFYFDAPLVRVRRSPQLPQIQYVVRTNFCDLGFHLASDGKRLVLISCLDNLLKGAASQAVQNMNLMTGWHEGEGLL